MLFSRIFNWIKYKTLPPSTLFLNRLFVERDSKHRRLMSNLGLTFRNSKWSMYARTNVSEINHASLYVSYLTIASFAIVLLLSYALFIYYDIGVLTNFVVVNLWFMIDCEIYATTLHVFLYWFITHTILTVSYAQLFDLTAASRNFTDPTKDSNNFTNISIPKRLYKSILYKWSMNPTFRVNELTFFDSSLYSAQDSCHKFYSRLFRLLTLLIKDHTAVNYYSSVLQDCSKTLDLTTSSTSKLNSLFSSTQAPHSKVIFMEYTLRHLSKRPMSYLHEFDLWNLSLVFNEWSSYKSIIPLQPFYLRQLSYTYVNHSVVQNAELSTLIPSLESQTTLRSVHKWIYKYNLLHRSSLRDSSQMTFLLQHLAPSFYASTFFSRNMWTSSTLIRSSNESIGVGGYHEALGFNNLFYQDTTLLHPNSLFRNFHNTAQISLFPLSYNWTIQRFYNFNTLSAHNTQWLKNCTNLWDDGSTASGKTYSNSFLQFLWRVNKHHGCYISPFGSDVGYWARSHELHNANLNSNIYLSYVDYNLFSKLNTELSLNLTSNQGAPTLLFYSLQPIQSY